MNYRVTAVIPKMVLTGHNVTLYTYNDLNHVPNGINGMEHEKVESGFYHDLKEAILTSSTKKEYERKIRII